MEEKPGISEKQEGKEGKLTGEKAKVIEKGEIEKVKLGEEMKFAGVAKPAEEEKVGVEEESMVKGEKPEVGSTDKDKSQTGKRKPERGESKYETKPTREKIQTKGENQGNEEDLLADRHVSEIEKGNSGEGDKDEARKDIKGVEELEEDERTGDFVKRKEYIFEDFSFTPAVQLQYSSSEDEEDGEDEEEQEEFNREAALEKYKSLQAERRAIVRKNIILLKKLAEHFKERKMEHVYENPEPHSADKEVRYHNQLLIFEEIRTTEKKEREVITKKLEELKKQGDEFLAHLKVLFDSLIEKEREIGTRLIDTKTGKVILDRVLEELLSRQMKKLNELREMRLAFFKIRECVAAKKAELQSLETFGENLNLLDYKKLQMENQRYALEIEKGDKELQYLSNKVTSVMQILAQMKEKSYATEEKIEELHELLRYTESEVNRTRGYVTNLKKRRHFHRSETLRLHRAAGLLTRPCLLRDFEVSIEEAARLSMKLQNIKNSFYDQQLSLTKIRKSIESHISNGTIRREKCSASEARHQREKCHFTVFKKQKHPVRYASHSKPHCLHPITSECFKQSSVVGDKPAMSTHVSRPRTEDSFRLTPMIPINKVRPSFFPPFI